MIGLLDAPDPFQRIEAASFFVDTGGIEDPVIRALVERMIDDPDKENGLTVSIMLSHYDHKKQTRAAYDAKRARAEPREK